MQFVWKLNSFQIYDRNEIERNSQYVKLNLLSTRFSIGYSYHGNLGLEYVLSQFLKRA